MNQLILILTTIEATYNAMMAFFYQRIIQSNYTNAVLSKVIINWALLIPASQNINDLNSNQVSAQIQAYIDLCSNCVSYIETTLNLQTNPQIEQIQSTLAQSITAINNFALQLLNAQNQSIIYYTTDNVMGLSIAMAINGIDLSTYLQQAQLNSAIPDLASIPAGTKLTFARS